jgi:hypothetical protein
MYQFQAGAIGAHLVVGGMEGPRDFAGDGNGGFGGDGALFDQGSQVNARDILHDHRPLAI